MARLPLLHHDWLQRLDKAQKEARSAGRDGLSSKEIRGIVCGRIAPLADSDNWRPISKPACAFFTPEEAADDLQSLEQKRLTIDGAAYRIVEYRRVLHG
jgi:hypothetical protein